MYKRNGIKIIFLSSFVLVLCLLIISLGTYGLFSQEVKIESHLQAGTLNVKLERTCLKYNNLNENGLLEELENKERVDFTKTTSDDKNIFDLSNTDYIVPGSYYEATMLLTNEGDVAFDYWIKIDLKDGFDSHLRNQIKVTVLTYQDGIEIETIGYLDDNLEVGNESLPLDSILVGEHKSFIVKVEFIHSSMNNSAMEEEVNFDLTVYAVQKTNK